jgi:hypothetical protein
LEVRKGKFEPYLLMTDDSGFIIQFAVGKILEDNQFVVDALQPNVKPQFKDVQIINNENIEVTTVLLFESKRLKLSYLEMGLMKAHEKPIVLALKIKLEIIVTLSISIDGYIRLWNGANDCLFSLKIPSLTKIAWNMKEIEDIRNRKSIEELLSIFRDNYSEVMREQSSPIQTYNKSKRLKHRQDPPSINYNEPIKLDFENKDIEDIVLTKPDYYTTQFSAREKGKTTHQLNRTQKVYPHPWRTRK